MTPLEPAAPFTESEARRAAAAYCAAAERDSVAVVDRRMHLDRLLAQCPDERLAERITDDVVRRLKRHHPVEAGYVVHDAGRRAMAREQVTVALGAFAEARELLNADMPALAAVALDTAELLIDLGDFDAAAFHLENARAYWTVAGVLSSRGDAGFMLGDVLAAAGRRREAGEAYATAAIDYDRAGLERPAVECRALAATFTSR